MKRIISILIATMLAFSATCVAQENETALLAQMDIMNGFPDGQFYPELFVTRGQFSKIAVQASKYKNMVATGTNTSPFTDVTYTHWAAPYIKTASANKLILGYPDSTFLPENNVTLAEAVTVAVKLLGYTDSDFSASWPYGQMGVANNIGLTDKIDAGMNDPLTRGQVRTLIYNMLRANSKGGGEYITSLGYNVIEDVTLIATNKENASVGAGKIHTSNGTYKIGDNFDTSFVGSRGDIVVKDKTAELFFADNQRKEEYIVYSASGDNIVVYGEGGLINLGIDKSVRAYYNMQETSLGTLVSSFETGYGITVFYNENGVVDYTFVTSGNIEGPVAVNSLAVIDSFGLSENATYMRDGKKASKTDISINDIIYVSTELDTIWSYSKKVTGIYEKALPNKDMVTSVTVSGVQYQLESANAMSALSSGGKFELGQSVTLLLGKDGKVADVISPTGANETMYGILIDSGKKEFTDTNSNSTTSYYVTLLKPSGEVVTYMAKSKYDSFKNSVVRISVNGAVASVSRANKSESIYGTVDADKMMLGSKKLAEDIKIIDITTTQSYSPLNYTTVFPARLDGVNLTSSDVLYYEKNASGEIDALILNDVTGDCYSYGIVTKASTNERGGTYEYVIGASNGTINSPSTKFLVDSGAPAKFNLSGNAAVNITELIKVSSAVTDVTSTYVQTSAGKYLLSDKAVAYNEKNMLVPMSDVIGNDEYNVTAYYDNHPNKGGRVRVLKVTKK